MRDAPKVLVQLLYIVIGYGAISVLGSIILELWNAPQSPFFVALPYSAMIAGGVSGGRVIHESLPPLYSAVRKRIESGLSGIVVAFIVWFVALGVLVSLFGS